MPPKTGIDAYTPCVIITRVKIFIVGLFYSSNKGNMAAQEYENVSSKCYKAVSVLVKCITSC